MAEILCSGQIDTPDLARLLMMCQAPYAPGQALLLSEQLPTHVIHARERQSMLRFEIYRQDVDVIAYTSGRLFQHNFELRWERHGTRFQVVYLGSDENRLTLYDFNVKEDPIFSQLIEGQRLECREKKYYLFGEALREEGSREGAEAIRGSSFAEARIPRILYYPVQMASQYVYLIVREYVCKETAQIECFRFQSLEPSMEQ